MTNVPTYDPLLAFGSAGALMAVHLLAAKWAPPAHFGRAAESCAGGVAVAYVFAHLLPMLAHLGRSEDYYSLEILFAGALAGTCLYLAVDRLEDGAEASRAWLSFAARITAFAAYNLVLGIFLTTNPPATLVAHFVVLVALSMHFVVVDRHLRSCHTHAYDRLGRWVVAPSILVGAIIGSLQVFPFWLHEFFFALLAGGMILNVLRQEIPQTGNGQLLPFTAGAALFGALFVFSSMSY